MEYLFLLADLQDRSVLVVGGGNVAARKISLLKSAGAKIRVVAQTLSPELKSMEHRGDLVWIGKEFKSDMLNFVFLVIVATTNKDINSFIYQTSEKYCKFINVVDDQSKCSLIFPAIIDRSPVIVAVSSSGKAPVLTRMLREKLESLLPSFLGSLANLIGNWRDRVKNNILSVDKRRRFWEKVLHNNIFNTLIVKGLFDQANDFLCHVLDRDKNVLEELIGNVALVGAGPGDVGLFTLRGLQVIQEADIVLYDYLITPEILDLIRRDAKKICVGKRGGCKKISMEQNKINRLLIKLAKKGNRVVRLKGGDPFIFGRGGEELEAVVQSGIPCEVVPGVTAASSVSIYAGIPLTHRDYAHSVIFLTGHFFSKFHSKGDLCFLNQTYQTLVIYMGSIYVNKIRSVLIDNGYDVQMPVAVISRGTCHNQKVVVGILDNLENLVKISCSPSLLIVGRVVSLHYTMSYLSQENIKKYKFTSLVNLF